MFSRTDFIVNNIVESFKANIHRLRDNPIITLFEQLRLMFTFEFAEQSEKGKGFSGIVCPIIKRKLDKVAMKSRDHTVGHTILGIY